MREVWVERVISPTTLSPSSNISFNGGEPRTVCNGRVGDGIVLYFGSKGCSTAGGDVCIGIDMVEDSVINDVVVDGHGAWEEMGSLEVNEVGFFNGTFTIGTVCLIPVCHFVLLVVYVGAIFVDKSAEDRSLELSVVVGRAFFAGEAHTVTGRCEVSSRTPTWSIPPPEFETPLGGTDILCAVVFPAEEPSFLRSDSARRSCSAKFNFPSEREPRLFKEP